MGVRDEMFEAERCKVRAGEHVENRDWYRSQEQ